MSPSSRARRASLARCAFATVAMVLVMMFSRLDAGAVTVAPPAVAFVEPESGPASATYREGQTYGLRLDVDGERVLEGTPASALVRATVTIVNAVDRAEETLTVTTQGGATSTFDETTSTLIIERGDSVGEASTSTSAIRETLKLLNYTHSGNRIGELTRIVTMTVTDEAGRTSAPAAKMIDITRDNVKPTLDLNGPREGTTYEVSMSEAERMIGVRLSDIDYTCEDGDDVVINSVTVQSTDAGAFPDGAVEYVSADTSGTSISSSWSAADKRLTLSNFDSVANYCRVVGTVRYHNEGTEQNVDGTAYSGGELRTSTQLQFTPGRRSFKFTIVDSSGSGEQAYVYVDVEDSTRSGSALYDDLITDPPLCNGNGNRDVSSTVCTCTTAEYSGDDCETHKCSERGQYDFVNEVCACDTGFSGESCEIECDGRGTYNETSSSCQCRAGFVGRDCSVACVACSGENGVCEITTASEASWNDALREYTLHDSVCACKDEWVGSACTEKCPCAIEPLGMQGTCGTDPVTESGICVCQSGYTGKDCSIRCGSQGRCGVSGTCVAPPEYEDGIGARLLEIFNNVSLSTSTTVRRAKALEFQDDISELTLCECSADEDGAVLPAGVICNNCTRQATCTCPGGSSGPMCTDECFAHGQVQFLSLVEIGELTSSTPLPDADGFFDETRFNTTTVYGRVNFEGRDVGYCQCDEGWTGEFCQIQCAPCDSQTGQCVYNGTHGECVCANGFTGADCSTRCNPCVNGVCSMTGSCTCDPGYAGFDCSIECGDIVSGSRGTRNLNGALLGLGLLFSEVTCECDQGYTGPMCSYTCPYAYNTDNGVCVVKSQTDRDAERGTAAEDIETEIVCKPGWTGLPALDRIPADSMSRGRDCNLACDACVHGTCQDDGECVCDYGYIWQPATRASSDIGKKMAITPYPWYAGASNSLSENDDVGGTASQYYNASHHTCAVRHPCNTNGEYLSASCAPGFSLVETSAQAWTTADTDGGGGWGCSGTLSPDGSCTGGDVLLAMPYITKRSDGLIIRDSASLERHDQWGVIMGGVCRPTSDEFASKLPIANGYCLCDSIHLGREKFPSLRDPGKSYSDYWQGWAGSTCDIPCAPCSENGVCDSATGECTCKQGFTGYRCLTTCETCVHGTCQYDGSCLCDGSRRLIDHSFALRLDRDPRLPFTDGDNELPLVDGVLPNGSYIHPYYMSAWQVEDFVWGVESLCYNSTSTCSDRTLDTILPFRPNETYFRYGVTTSSAEVTGGTLSTLEEQLETYQNDIVNIPGSMQLADICAKSDYKLDTTQGVCMSSLTSMTNCGDDWKSANPWDCDDTLKAHFLQDRKQLIGGTRINLKIATESSDEGRWFRNSKNERQRLMNVFLRGRFDATTGSFRTFRDTADKYMAWIMNQLIHGVNSGDDAYTGANCQIKCDACDPDHGTCQFDGSCECETGWYGRACNKSCDCYKDLVTNDDGSVEELIKETAHGVPIKSWGHCERDGSCTCGVDDGGVQYSGTQCFKPCDPCHNGLCDADDGSCACNKGWLGKTCDIRNFTECLPCNYDHGTCLTDGTCKCDKGWTGLKCDIKCSPCVNGDCQMDGSCACKAGWSFVDCSRQEITTFMIKSDFTEGPEGWTVYNNSCSGVLDELLEDSFDLFAINSDSLMRGACSDTFSGGDSGLLWEGISGYLHLTDKLTRDAASELAYLRAPPKFTGDLLSQNLYNASITYSLHMVGERAGSFSSKGSPHEEAHQTSAYDIILIGGLPRYKREIPSWGTSDQVYSWVRTNFPELSVNSRLTRSEMIKIVEQYLNTPQVFLGYKVPSGQEGYPPSSCSSAKCGLNFKVDIVEGGEWVNLDPILSGFKWSNDPAVHYIDGTTFTSRVDGAPYNPFSGYTEDTFDVNSAISINTATTGRSDGGTVLVQSSTRALATDKLAADVYPEVYEAVVANRRTRTGQSASFTDIAWCLSSVQEILVRGDYYVQESVDPSATVIGESVRFDSFGIGTFVEAENKEQISLLNYYRQYAADYSSAYLDELYQDLRPTVCAGRWYLKGEPDPQLGDACKYNTADLRTQCVGMFDVTSVELGDYCVIRCPGYDGTVTCSGFGTCGLDDDDEPSCTCDSGYVADATAGCVAAT